MKNMKKVIIILSFTAAICLLAACSKNQPSDESGLNISIGEETGNENLESEQSDNKKIASYEEYAVSLRYLDDLETKLSEANTTLDMVDAIGSMLEGWDNELNRIYGLLNEKLSTVQREELRTMQRLWIKERDQLAAQNAAVFEGGSFSRVAYHDTLFQCTRQRTFELAAVYFNDGSDFSFDLSIIGGNKEFSIYGDILRDPELYSEYYAITENIASENSEIDYDGTKSYCYAIYDINNDGIKELLLGYGKYFDYPKILLNILQYDKELNRIIDLDGDRTYPLMDNLIFYESGYFSTQSWSDDLYTECWNIKDDENHYWFSSEQGGDFEDTYGQKLQLNEYYNMVGDKMIPVEWSEVRDHSDTESVTKVSWKVIDYGGPPYFHLYVKMNEEEYYAGYFYGENFETGRQIDTPEHALTAAGAIWTGAGEHFYIYQKSETELALMNHYVPYASQPEEWEEYQEVITIPVTKGNKIELGDMEYVREPYAWSQKYSFILYDGFLLGGLNISDTMLPISEENLEEYWHITGDWGFRLFQDGQYLDTVSYHGYADEWLRNIVTGVSHENIEKLLVELEYNGERFDGLAVNDGAPLTFGTVMQLDPTAEVYVDYIAEILADHGLEDETVHIREIVKTDLEGDGMEEVLLIASNIDSPDQRNGQYSIAVIRKVMDGKVESLFLTKEIRNGLPDGLENRLLNNYELLEIVDLDHDDVCELLIKQTYYEGDYYHIYKLVDGEMRLILENGFGY